MAVNPLNEYHGTDFRLGDDEDPDTTYATGRVLNLAAPVEAAPMLLSADKLTVMSFTD